MLREHVNRVRFPDWPNYFSIIHFIFFFRLSYKLNNNNNNPSIIFNNNIKHFIDKSTTNNIQFILKYYKSPINNIFGIFDGYINLKIK